STTCPAVSTYAPLTRYADPRRPEPSGSRTITSANRCGSTALLLVRQFVARDPDHVIVGAVHPGIQGQLDPLGDHRGAAPLTAALQHPQPDLPVNPTVTLHDDGQLQFHRTDLEL